MGSTRRALLVANGRFRDKGLQDLRGPRNDVRALRHALTAPPTGLYAPSDVEIVLDRQSHEMSREIERFFGRAGRDDELLLYYSGHGLLGLRGELFLCGADTVRESLRATALASPVLSEMIDDSSARVKIILLDCCYAGDFKGGLPIPVHLHGRGRFVLTSSQRGHLSPDSKTPDAPSPFTEYVADALQRSELDTDHDGYISVDDVCNYVAERCRESRLTPGRSFDTGFETIALARAVPRLHVENRAISFGNVEAGSPPPRVVIELVNKGGGLLRPKVREVEGLLTDVRESELVVLLDTSRPRILTGDLQLVTDGGTGVIRISGRVVAKPLLEVRPSMLDLGIVRAGQPVSGKLTIVNAGGGHLHWNHTETGGFFRSHVVDDEVIVTVDAGAGTHVGEIVVRSNGGDKRIEVRVTILPGEPLMVAPPPAQIIADVATRPAPGTMPDSGSHIGSAWGTAPGRAWPVQPSEQIVRSVLAEWAQRQRGIPDNFFERELLLSNESIARLEVTRLLETRDEMRVIKPGGPPKLEAYDRLEDVILPFVGWRTSTRREILRGSAQTTLCDRCKGVGRQPCVECRGRGSVSCLECYGADKSCWRCHGSGSLECSGVECEAGRVPCAKCQTTGSITLYVEGRVGTTAEYTVIEGDLGHLMPNAAAYYRPIHRAVGDVDLSDIPFSERIRLEERIPPRAANELDRKVELSVLPVVSIRYVAGNGAVRRAYLVGEELVVHAPGVRPRHWPFRWFNS